MTLSVWRYSHLALAISSFLFIIVAAVTGSILAFQPINTQITTAQLPKASTTTVATTITALQKEYLEILDLKVSKNNLVSASVITDEGDVAEFYINPNTGEKVADIVPENTIYKFAKTLHRSLFLKTTGRICIAIISFCLLLITASGIILIIKRQQGLKNFFKPIIKDDFYQHAHTYFGRLFLLPILLITASGVLISLFQFNILTDKKDTLSIDFNTLKTTPQREIIDFPAFKDLPLSSVEKIEFPFSTDVEDVFTVTLYNKQIAVNQITGETVSSVTDHTLNTISDWSMAIHTGESSAVWAFVLLAACISILFFIYSGFKIMMKRSATKLKNSFKLQKCTHLILVGSETGSTLSFAVWVQEQLIKHGKKVFIAEMNTVEIPENITQLLVFTSTYGVGEAPENAKKFVTNFKKLPAQHRIHYAVVGFGSFAYPNYCEFAYVVDKEMSSKSNYTQLLPIHTVNNKSTESFNQWILQYNQIEKETITPYKTNTTNKKAKKKEFIVTTKTNVLPNDNTFTLTLAPTKKLKLKSGDLIGIAPNIKEHERLYSVGITKENHILLCVKLHEKGLCSNYLNQLQLQNTLTATPVKNKTFHFPKKATEVIMIATGTGIAPFLGMITNQKAIKKTLYWGAKNNQSLAHYAPIINQAIEQSGLSAFHPAYSRMQEQKVYVQHLIQRDATTIAAVLKSKGVIMICGSVLMQKDVLETLSAITLQHNNTNLSTYQKNGQLLMDCY